MCIPLERLCSRFIIGRVLFGRLQFQMGVYEEVMFSCADKTNCSMPDILISIWIQLQYISSILTTCRNDRWRIWMYLISFARLGYYPFYR